MGAIVIWRRAPPARAGDGRAGAAEVQRNAVLRRLERISVQHHHGARSEPDRLPDGASSAGGGPFRPESRTGCSSNAITGTGGLKPSAGYSPPHHKVCYLMKSAT